MDRIDFNNIQEKDYLYNSCNLLYNRYFKLDDKEKLAIVTFIKLKITFLFSLIWFRYINNSLSE